MSNERKLHDAMLLDAMWREAVQDMEANGWEIHEQVEDYSDLLAGAVIAGTLRVADLRAGVSWTNALDREAVEIVGTDLDKLGGKDRTEALARRIAHHSGRKALESVRSKERRLARYVTGRGSLALHDIHVRAGFFPFGRHDLH